MTTLTQSARARPDRPSPLLVTAVLLLTDIACPGLWAETGKTETVTTQAVLRITVSVVPVAMLPSPPQSKSDSAGGVTFKLPGTSPRMTATEELRPLAAGVFPTTSNEKHLAGATLKTLTVVAQ